MRWDEIWSLSLWPREACSLKTSALFDWSMTATNCDPYWAIALSVVWLRRFSHKLSAKLKCTQHNKTIIVPHEAPWRETSDPLPTTHMWPSAFSLGIFLVYNRKEFVRWYYLKTSRDPEQAMLEANVTILSTLEALVGSMENPQKERVQLNDGFSGGLQVK